MRGEDNSNKAPTRNQTRRQYLHTTGIATGALLGLSSLMSPTAAEPDGHIVLNYDAAHNPADMYTIGFGNSPEFDSEPVHKGTQSLRIDIPEGRHKGSDVRYQFTDNGASPQTELYQRCWVYADAPAEWGTDTSDNWRFFNCAFSNGPRAAGVNGRPTGDDGWSNRVYFTGYDTPDPGYANLLSYTYHMDQPEAYGESDYLTDHPVPLGEWVKFECHVKTNTVTNGTANADGEVTYWLNGNEIYHRNDFRFTTDRNSNIIDYGGPVGYYGGKYTAPTDLATYYDAHELWLDSNRPTAETTTGTSSPSQNTGALGGDGLGFLETTDNWLLGSLNRTFRAASK